MYLSTFIYYKHILQPPDLAFDQTRRRGLCCGSYLRRAGRRLSCWEEYLVYSNLTLTRDDCAMTEVVILLIADSSITRHVAAAEENKETTNKDTN
jgi:hypothetical protein